MEVLHLWVEFAISIKGDKKYLKYTLCKELKNKIFHITSQIGYEGILSDKAIYPSNHKNIKSHIWGFSEYGRYFTNENCVSVVDFYNNKNRKLVLSAIRKYRFYDIHSVAKGSIGYFLVLKSNLYKKVITWEQAKIDIDTNKKYDEQIVPNLESGVKNEISLYDIEYVVKVETLEKYIDREKFYTKLLKDLELKKNEKQNKTM
jgi:hypothetical protein